MEKRKILSSDCYANGVANTIYKQLHCPNTTIAWSWGITKPMSCYAVTEDGFKYPSLLFHVNGNKFKGDVLVQLNGSDYYDVDFIKKDKVVERKSDIDCFQLQEVIDNFVEKIAEYKF